MRNYKRLSAWTVALFLMLFFTSGLSAQYLNHPPSIKWKQIQTEHFVIIFSEDIEREALRVANLVEHYLAYDSKTLISSRRKTTIVLVSEAAESNGGIMYAPYMGEYYNSPSTFAANEWYTALSVHEIRHTVQLNKINMGGRKIFWYAFGDLGAAVYTVLFVPRWFLEGDAVLTETALTDGGRGRLPVFDLWQRTNELSAETEKRYSYYRAYLGAPDDNYPYSNYYVLGYHMVTHGRRKYGPMVWNNVITDLGNGTIFQYAHYDDSVIRNTSGGKNIIDLYNDTYDDLRMKWLVQISGLKLTDSATVIPADDRYWSGYFSLQESGGRLYALQTGKGLLTGITEITGRDKRRFIHKVPITTALSRAAENERPVSIGGGYAVWTESVSDLRWGKRSYSSIMLCNLKTGGTSRLYPNGKFLSAAVSRDGNKIAAVEFNSRRKCYLTVIDVRSRRITARFAIDDRSFIYDPVWTEDGNYIIAGILSEKGSGLNQYDSRTGRQRILIPQNFDEHPKTPYVSKNLVYYGSDYSGIDNIWVIDLKTKRRYQVTSRRFGAYFPSVSESGEYLYYSDYSVKGYSGEKMTIDPAGWVPINRVKADRIEYFRPVVSQEAGRSIAGEVPEIEYNVENYNTLFNTFNVHSWMPVLFYYYGLEIYSTDYLNTTAAAAAYNYFPNENSHSVYGYLSYSGFYPVIDIGGLYGGRAKIDKDGNNIFWDETTAYGNTTLPFDFSRGLRTLYISGKAGCSMSRINNKTESEVDDPTVLNSGELYSMSFNAAFIHAEEGTVLDIYPRWAQIVYVDYTDSLKGDYSSRQIAVSGALFFPSLFMHHSIFFNGGFEYDSPDEYRYQMKFLYPRGYKEDYSEEFYKLSANYAFPLINLDIAVWKLLYIKRIQSEILYDFGMGITDSRRFYRRSAGAELMFEFNPFSCADIVLKIGGGWYHCQDSGEDVFAIAYRLGEMEY